MILCVLVKPRKMGNRPDTTENLLTGMQGTNTNNEPVIIAIPFYDTCRICVAMAHPHSFNRAFAGTID